MQSIEAQSLYQNQSVNGTLLEKVLQEPSVHQLSLLLDEPESRNLNGSYRDKLIEVLSGNLDFHGQDTGYASHDFHPFPAKFPPQLPRTFIRALTQPGDMVLDPMMGSGTTVLEAYLANCRAIGVDIDPLAKLITQVKTTSLETKQVFEIGDAIVAEALNAVSSERSQLEAVLQNKWDTETLEFVEYWFARDTQIELLALACAIEKITDDSIRAFFQLTLSACIITKSGGVSLAFDLAHTRPHRAKMAYTSTGELVIGKEYEGDTSKRVLLLTKKLKSAIVEFRKRYKQNARELVELISHRFAPHTHWGDAQNLSIENASIDLIVTSPPYASNAIDYMRAHKFSLVWLGYSINSLGDTRKQCIGGEGISNFQFETLPRHTQTIINRIAELDSKKAQVLHRYYSEMHRTLREMYRVLKPDRAAVLVVASSLIRNCDIEVDQCLAEIGKLIGFEVPKIAVRSLDRNRRMLPASHQINYASQIQKRMHEEFVIGFYKPLDAI